MRKFGPTVESVETWVNQGIADGWCKPVPSHDRPGRFRRRFVADLSMGCEDPPTFEVWARYNRRAEQVRGIFVDITGRCRKCQTCLDNKARYWTARAMDEFQRSTAVYMVTLTIAPELHYQFDARMKQPLFRGSRLVREAVGPFDGLAPATLFRLRAREIGYEITDYLKRLRKRAKFRYLLVAERHMKEPNSPVYGRPHFHILLHEGAIPLVQPHEWQPESGYCQAGCKHRSGRVLLHPKPGMVHDNAFVRTQWPHGHTTVVRCIDVKSAVYVCKYVSKDPMARIRASQGYGKNLSEEESKYGVRSVKQLTPDDALPFGNG
jgi:hypothetical protein